MRSSNTEAPVRMHRGDKEVQLRGGRVRVEPYENVMDARALSSVSNGEIVGGLRRALAAERAATAKVLAYLGEVEARELHLAAACSSMHVYCVSVLGMSEQAAYKRARVARVARRFPVVLEAIETGQLHLSGAMVLAPHLAEENVEARVRAASGMTRAEIERLVAGWAPRPDVETRVEKLGEQPALLAPDDAGRLSPGINEQPVVAPLAPERFAVQVTVSGAVVEKLERATSLLRHQVPSGDVAAVIEKALDALIEKVERRKFGAAKAPRASAEKCVAKRTVPRAVRRAVVARDGQQCSFVSDDGRRCEETGFLELDHVVPVARGGQPTVDGVRVFCRSHNQFEARRVLGRESVEAARAAAQMDADVLSGLKRMGVTAADARLAVAESRGQATSIEERLRAALAVLHRIYTARRGTRCEQERATYGVRRAALGRR